MADLDQGPNQAAAEVTHSLSRTATLFSCAAIGGLCAAIADVVQKDDASAVSKITSVAARNLQLQVQPLWVLLGLVLLAVLLCFVFQPSGRRPAFGIGAGVIATIMTVTPYQQPLTGLPSDGSGDGAWLSPTGGVRVAALGDAPLLMASEASYRTYRFRVANRASRALRVSVAVFDSVSGQEYRQNQAIAAGGEATFPFAMRGLRPGGQIFYTIEADGAPVIRQSMAVSTAPSSTVPVTLTDAIIGNGAGKGSILQLLQKRLGTGTRF